jgi:protein-disulfide isomerase
MHRALALSLSLLLAAAVGCRTASPGDDASGAVAARIGDDVVTVDELDQFIMEDLFERETRGGNPSRVHDLRSKAVQALVRERALEREAERRGLTTEALLAVVKTEQAVGEEEVASFYEENRAQLRGATLEQAAPRIRAHLENERALKSILDAAGVEVVLERPRVQVSSEGPSIGPADAPVTIVEFSDFQCPYCQRALPALKAVADKYPQQVRIVYRHLPLESIHPQARAGAEAAECAAEDGRFWEYHDLLFEHPRAMSQPDLRRYAEQVGLDAEAFDACLSSRRHAAAIDEDVREANAVGITGTPAFVVNGIVLFGLQSEEALTRVIEEELARDDS